MNGVEGERISLGRNLKARGNVEQWLSVVEHNMRQALQVMPGFSLGSAATMLCCVVLCCFVLCCVVLCCVVLCCVVLCCVVLCCVVLCCVVLCCVVLCCVVLCYVPLPFLGSHGVCAHSA